MKARIQVHDIVVLGVTDHRVFKSIYLFNPHGIRLELCAQLASNTQMRSEQKALMRRLPPGQRKRQSVSRRSPEVNMPVARGVNGSRCKGSHNRRMNGDLRKAQQASIQGELQ